jgi:hypothetical protein
MMLEVCWDGLWTLSFGLSQFRVTALGSCVKWALSDKAIGVRAWVKTATTETTVFRRMRKNPIKKIRKVTQWAQIGQLHAVRGTNPIIL